jgi:hypothetical protein
VEEKFWCPGETFAARKIFAHGIFPDILIAERPGSPDATRNAAVVGSETVACA